MAKKPYDEFNPEIRELVDAITTRQFSGIRNVALQNWLSDQSKDADIVARAWITATLIVLTSNGYELKKKS